MRTPNTPKVLLVEDDYINGMALQRYLQKNFECNHVIDGPAALRETSSKKYDCLVLDINLGENQMTGEEIMLYLRQNPPKYSLTFIALTGYSMPGFKERMLEAGFDFFIPKPVNYVQLNQLIWQALAKRRPYQDEPGAEEEE